MLSLLGKEFAQLIVADDSGQDKTGSREEGAEELEIGGGGAEKVHGEAPVSLE